MVEGHRVSDTLACADIGIRSFYPDGAAGDVHIGADPICQIPHARSGRDGRPMVCYQGDGRGWARA